MVEVRHKGKQTRTNEKCEEEKGGGGGEISFAPSFPRSSETRSRNGFDNRVDGRKYDGTLPLPLVENLIFIHAPTMRQFFAVLTGL